MKPGSSFKSFISLNTLLITALILAALYLYLTGLKGAMVMYNDENRAYHLALQSPLIYMIVSPFTHFFKTTDAPHYVFAVIGLLNVGLLTYLGIRVLGVKYALPLLAFTVFYDYQLVFSKLLFFSNLITFLLLISTHLSITAVKRSSYLLLFFAGFFSGLMFVTNPSSYALIGFTFIFTVYCLFSSAFGSFEKAKIKAAAAFLAGTAAAWMTFECYLYIKFQDRPNFEYMPYIKFLSWYQDQSINSTGVSGPRHLLDFLSIAFHRQFLVTPSEFFRNTFLLISVFSGLIFAFKEKHLKLIGVILLCGGTFLLYLTNAFLQIHIVETRHVTWIIPGVIICSVYAWSRWWGSKRKWLKKSLAAVLAVYFLLAGVKCYAVTHSLFSVHSINEVLKEKNIKKSEIATIFHINRDEDYLKRDAAKILPLVPVTNEEWRRQEIYYAIHWPILFNMYKKGLVKYYLSSGLRSHAGIGLNDAFLLNTEPIAVWDYHPMNNWHLRTDPRDYDIKLYRLRDIFETAAKMKERS